MFGFPILAMAESIPGVLQLATSVLVHSDRRLFQEGCMLLYQLISQHAAEQSIAIVEWLQQNVSQILRAVIAAIVKTCPFDLVSLSTCSLLIFSCAFLDDALCFHWHLFSAK